MRLGNLRCISSISARSPASSSSNVGQSIFEDSNEIRLELQGRGDGGEGGKGNIARRNGREKVLNVKVLVQNQQSQ